MVGIGSNWPRPVGECGYGRQDDEGAFWGAVPLQGPPLYLSQVAAMHVEFLMMDGHLPDRTGKAKAGELTGGYFKVAVMPAVGRQSCHAANSGRSD